MFSKIIIDKQYEGFDYRVVVNTGGWRGWFCGYVNVSNTHLNGIDYCDKEFPDIDVHGGVTFTGKLKDVGGFWVGWDYAHLYDAPIDKEILLDFFKDDEKAIKEIHRRYEYNNTFDGSLEYTAENVENDCKSVIDQLKELTKTQLNAEEEIQKD